MNNINRNNYEEFFILHLDNELNAEQQQALQLFLQQNPDLQAELDLLSGTKLSVDETVVFPDKALLFAGSLLQQTEEGQVSAQDSEIIMYLDAELTEKDKKAFEQKLAGNTILQQQVALFAKTKLQASAAEVFPDKTLLYKEEENRRRIVPMYWLRMGVAAAVLLTLGVGGFNWLNNPVKEVNNGLASHEQQPAGTKEGVTPVTSDPVKDTPANNEQGLAVNESENNQDVNTVHYTTGSTTQKTVNPGKTPGNDFQTAVVKTNGNDVVKTTETNNLPSVLNNPNYSAVNETVANTAVDVKPIDNNNGKNGMIIPPVKNNNQVAFASNSQHVFDEVVEVEEPENKKNKLRGFLRKVTRNFQKQTSIDMTNGDDQLLVAGFALKM